MSLSAIRTYYSTFFHFYCGGKISNMKKLTKERLRTVVWIWSLVQNVLIWDQPHYRHPSFSIDAQTNLRNVSIPYMWFTLKWFCFHKVCLIFFLLIVYPYICFCAAIQACFLKYKKGHKWSLSTEFSIQLLRPEDWFSYWRLNCVLTSWVWLKTKTKDVELEHKMKFIQKCQVEDLPVTPTFNFDVVTKHVNEEGGLGVYSYSNVENGGEYIVQPRFKNSDEIAELLPADAPLCTFRVCTISNVASKKASLICVVFRAGRRKAETDHSCVLCPVNPNTGELQRGTYQWCRDNEEIHHPDTGKRLEGEKISHVKGMCDLCIKAHEKLCPDVPVVGWDITNTLNHGVLFLEANLSANLHKGNFDRSKYFSQVYENIKFIETELERKGNVTI